MAEENSMIHGMLITLVTVAPQELLIEQLEKGLREYKEAMLLYRSEEDKKKILEGALSLPCLMILIKSCGIDPIKMIKDMSDLERVRNLIKPNLS
jgi:hypothetical protein